MTIDANIDRQPRKADGGRALISTGAIGLSKASNCRIRRVRVINFGTNTAPNDPGTSENFPLWIEGPELPHPGGENLVEDCIIEQPGLSPAREGTLLNVHDRKLALNMFCTVRNNYINGDFTTGEPPLPVEVSSAVIAQSGTRIDVETLWPHRVQAGDWVRLFSTGATAYEERMKVAAADDFRTCSLERSIQAAPPSSSMMLQRFVPEAMPITDFQFNPTTGVVTLTLPKVHRQKAGDWIRVAGISANTSPYPFNNPFNGSFQVTNVPAGNPAQLEYQLYANDPTALTPALTGIAWLNRWPSQTAVVQAPNNLATPPVPPGLQYHSDGYGNYFRNVSNGIVFDRTSGKSGRIIAMGNTVELRTSSGTPSHGIHLKANAASRYGQVIARKNVVGQIDNPPGENTDLNGLRFEGCDDLNAEENLIDNAPTEKAVTFANCTSATFFNNQNTAGQLLRAHDGTRYKLELADEVQDVLLAAGSSKWRL